MPKTIVDLQNLLRRHGFAVERGPETPSEAITVTIPTTTYKGPMGETFLEIQVSFDSAGDCVALESLRAFDLKNTAQREATLACLLTAASRAPLVRTTLDPGGQRIRLRVDCPCDADGPREDDVLKAVALLPAFAEAWCGEINSAMTLGTFDAESVAKLSVPKVRRGKRAPRSGSKPSPRQQAESIRQKPGAGVNRLKTLFAFQQWLASLPPRDDADGPAQRPNAPRPFNLRPDSKTHQQPPKEDHNDGHDA
jgi:hypothetical protein